MRTLKAAKPGDVFRVSDVLGNAEVHRRLTDMGITPGVKVKVCRLAPLGDPIQIEVRGYKLSIRKSEAAFIIVS